MQQQLHSADMTMGGVADGMKQCECDDLVSQRDERTRARAKTQQSRRVCAILPGTVSWSERSRECRRGEHLELAGTADARLVQ